MLKLKRFWRYLVALFGVKLDQFEDLDLLLTKARREMNDVHARNRERAVEAITLRQHLQQRRDETWKRMDSLLAAADAAEARGDEEAAVALLKERAELAETLAATEQSLAQLLKTVEEVINAIRREEEAFHRELRLLRGSPRWAIGPRTPWNYQPAKDEDQESPGADKALTRLMNAFCVLLWLLLSAFLALKMAGL